MAENAESGSAFPPKTILKVWLCSVAKDRVAQWRDLAAEEAAPTVREQSSAMMVFSCATGDALHNLLDGFGLVITRNDDGKLHAGLGTVVQAEGDGSFFRRVHNAKPVTAAIAPP